MPSNVSATKEEVLQKYAAELTSEYLLRVFDELYPRVYRRLEKIAKENQSKNSKRAKLLGLLAALVSGTATAATTNRLLDKMQSYAWSNNENAAKRWVETGGVAVPLTENPLNDYVSVAAKLLQPSGPSKAPELYNPLYERYEKSSLRFIPSSEILKHLGSETSLGESEPTQVLQLFR
ncbi:MAG: hypothetical protein QXE80_08820 [Pyrobaculum sp.]